MRVHNPIRAAGPVYCPGVLAQPHRRLLRCVRSQLQRARGLSCSPTRPWRGERAPTRPQRDANGDNVRWARKWKERQTLDSLPHYSPQELKQRVESGTATLEDISASIHQVRKRVQHLPIEQRRQEVRELHLGGTVLHWLWELPTATRDEMSEHQVFVQLVCWCLVAEGRKRFIWQWLENEGQAAARPAALRHWDTWAARWLGRTTEAQFHWADEESAHEPMCSFRDAFTTFGPIMDRYRPLSKAGVYVGMFSAMEWIVSSWRTAPYEERLFDFYYAKLPQYLPPEVARRQQAVALLYHPSTPDPIPFADLLAEDLPHTEAVWTARDTTVYVFSLHVLRAAYILRLQGRLLQAQQLDAKVEAKAPRVWSQRKYILKDCVKDQKLDGVRSTGKVS